MSDTKAVLIFAEVSKTNYPVVRYVATGWDAYDRFQVPVYLLEILKIKISDDFVDDRNLFQELAKIDSQISAEQFFELGSTLFASIDKMEKCLGAERSKLIEYVGVEPSALMRDTAKLIHPSHSLKHYPYATDVPLPNKRLKTIHRSYQASSYAFRSTSQLVDWISRFGVSQDGIWFSLDDHDSHQHFLSGDLTVFSFPAFCTAMKEAGYLASVSSAQTVTHHGFKLYEIFLTSLALPIADELKYVLQEIKTIDDIPKDKWLKPRAVQISTTSMIDAMLHKRCLNFAGSFGSVWNK